MRLLIFLLIPIFSFSQTTFVEADIRAASGNNYETLLIGIPAVNTGMKVQNYTYDKTLWEAKWSDCGTGCHTYLVKNDPVGDQRNRHILFKIYYKSIGEGFENEITTKVVFTGDIQLLIQFFTEFWSRTLNFTDIKPGEIVSTRFLTDIATFSFDKKGNPQIVVEKAK